MSGSANGVSRAGLVLEEVRCTGTEEGLHACPTSPLGDITNPSCTSAAAVTCSRGEECAFNLSIPSDRPCLDVLVLASYEVIASGK